MREDAVLHARKEDDGELQSLGCVQGHERDHTIVIVGNLIGIGHKRDPLQEARQAGVLGVTVVLRGNRLQLSEVLEPRLILWVVGGLELGDVAGLLQHGLQDRGGTGA